MTDSSIKQMTLQAEYKTEIAMYSVLGSINEYLTQILSCWWCSTSRAHLLHLNFY